MNLPLISVAVSTPASTANARIKAIGRSRGQRGWAWPRIMQPTTVAFHSGKAASDRAVPRSKTTFNSRMWLTLISAMVLATLAGCGLGTSEEAATTSPANSKSPNSSTNSPSAATTDTLDSDRDRQDALAALATDETNLASDSSDPNAPNNDAPSDTQASSLSNEPTTADSEFPAAPEYQRDEDGRITEQTIELPKSWVRLSPQDEIWIDKENKQVVIGGEICLNAGPLEMFICPRGSKEHESVIAASAMASQMHMALVAIGAPPGDTCSWDPEYRPAHGPTIEIDLMWRDEATKKTITQPANQWIRNTKTKQGLETPWVFGGSEFWTDPDTNREYYYADSGEMVCLSNFSTASIDLSVESSQSNANLLFEAWTENIPPVGTKVYAVIKPGKPIAAVKQDATKDHGEEAPTAPRDNGSADESETSAAKETSDTPANGSAPAKAK